MCKICKYPCVLSVDKKTKRGTKPVYCPINGHNIGGWN